VDRAAHIALAAKLNQSEVDTMLYKRDILLFAITLGHGIHYSLVRTWKQIQDEKNGVELVEDLDWEYDVFGGHIVGCGIGTERDRRINSIAIQQKEGAARHFEVSDDQVKAIVDGKHCQDERSSFYRAGGLAKPVVLETERTMDQWTTAQCVLQSRRVL
jgi:hypothetical protein